MSLPDIPVEPCDDPRPFSRSSVGARLFGKEYIPPSVPRKDLRSVVPVNLHRALEARADALGVSMTRLVHDVLLTWVNAVRDYELQHERTVVEHLPLPSMIEPYRGYAGHLNPDGELDGGLETL